MPPNDQIGTLVETLPLILSTAPGPSPNASRSPGTKDCQDIPNAVLGKWLFKKTQALCPTEDSMVTILALSCGIASETSSPTSMGCPNFPLMPKTNNCGNQLWGEKALRAFSCPPQQPTLVQLHVCMLPIACYYNLDTLGETPNDLVSPVSTPLMKDGSEKAALRSLLFRHKK